jgi:hypothetical protein
MLDYRFRIIIVWKAKCFEEMNVANVGIEVALMDKQV